eukprot:TRINITY_DN7816_c1_g1_i3.p1 TRINITY_DN7816_c1_g1~~TRINITY_DN7816_c1_g1_i3.p1  ORF type:complete len:310 (-),score=53.49 TRINITY_DN7816_c1_g1_i3:9-902(-)
MGARSSSRTLSVITPVAFYLCHTQYQPPHHRRRHHHHSPLICIRSFSILSSLSSSTSKKPSFSYDIKDKKVNVGCDMTTDQQQVEQLRLYIRAHESVGGGWLHTLQSVVPGMSHPIKFNLLHQHHKKKSFSEKVLTWISSYVPSFISGFVQRRFVRIAETTSHFLESYIIDKHHDRTGVSIPTFQGRIHFTHFHPKNGLHFLDPDNDNDNNNNNINNADHHHKKKEKRLVEVAYEVPAVLHKDAVHTLFEGKGSENEKASIIVQLIASELLVVPLAGKLVGALSKHILDIIPGTNKK